MIVRLALGAKKPEHRNHRRKADAAVAQPFRVQPVFVEVESLGKAVENRLMEAWRQQAANPALCHDEAAMIALPSAAILAGGKARRLGGRDKSRLVIEGRSIIVRQTEVLQRVAHDIFIVGPQADLYADLELPVYADLLPGNGALGGVYTALEVAREDLVLTIACDLPFLDAGLLQRLVERSAGHDGAWIATDRGAEPLIACYRRDARTRVLDRLRRGALKAADLNAALDLGVVTADDVAQFGPIDRLLANVNTPEDFARIESTR